MAKTPLERRAAAAKKAWRSRRKMLKLRFPQDGEAPPRLLRPEPAAEPPPRSAAGSPAEEEGDMRTAKRATPAQRNERRHNLTDARIGELMREAMELDDTVLLARQSLANRKKELNRHIALCTDSGMQRSTVKWWLETHRRPPEEVRLELIERERVAMAMQYQLFLDDDEEQEQEQEQEQPPEPRPDEPEPVGPPIEEEEPWQPPAQPEAPEPVPEDIPQIEVRGLDPEELQRVYKAGFDAGMAGRGWENCPYQPATAQREHWLDGWDQAQLAMRPEKPAVQRSRIPDDEDEPLAF